MGKHHFPDLVQARFPHGAQANMRGRSQQSSNLAVKSKSYTDYFDCRERVFRSLWFVSGSPGKGELVLPGIVDEQHHATAAAPGIAAATPLRQLGRQVAGGDGDEAVFQAVVIAVLPQPRLADVIGRRLAVARDRERAEAAGHLLQILADDLRGRRTDD